MINTVCPNLDQKQRSTGQDHGQGAHASLGASVLAALGIAVAAAVTAVLVKAGGRAARSVSRGRAARAARAARVAARAAAGTTTTARAATAVATAVATAGSVAAAGNRARGTVTSTWDLGLGVLGAAAAASLGGGTLGRRSSRGGVWLAGIHVGTSALQRSQVGALVAIDDGVVGAGTIAVGVAGSGAGSKSRSGVVAIDGDGLKGGVKVAGLLDIGGVPVNLTTGPSNGSGGVAGETARPDGDLDTRGSLGEGPLVGGGVPVVLAVDGAADLAIDEPLDGVGGPSDFVVVEVVEGV